MEFGISLAIGGWILLIAASIVFGVVAQFVGETRTGFEWLIDAIAFGVGALIASEFIVAWQSLGPMFDGLAIVPALIGGLVLGLVAELTTRFLTGGTYSGRPMSAGPRSAGPIEIRRPASQSRRVV